jgi:hypothetical protein
VLLIVLLLFGGGGWYYTYRPGYAGPPELNGFIGILLVVVVIVLVVHLMGVA